MIFLAIISKSVWFLNFSINNWKSTLHLIDGHYSNSIHLICITQFHQTDTVLLLLLLSFAIQFSPFASASSFALWLCLSYISLTKLQYWIYNEKKSSKRYWMTFNETKKRRYIFFKPRIVWMHKSVRCQNCDHT